MDFIYPIPLLPLATAYIAGTIAAFVWRRVTFGGEVSDPFAGIYLIPIAVALAFFCATFTVMDTWVLVKDTWVHWRSTGNMLETRRYATLPLGITSLVVGYKVLEYAEKIRSIGSGKPLHFGSWITQQLPIDEEFTKRIQELPDFRDSETLCKIALAQYGIYLTVLSTLWILTATVAYGTLTSVLVGLLSWAFFFVIDDWAIIAEYSHSLKGRMLRWHSRRIHGFNIFLCVALLGVMLVTFLPATADLGPGSSGFLSVFFAVFILIFLYLRYGRLTQASQSQRRRIMASLLLAYAVIVGAYIWKLIETL